jgi:large subunit ribosomal protein L9
VTAIGTGSAISVQVILREDIEKIGLRGEVVDVAAGFARNYLLPRKLAEPASAGRVAELEKLAASRSRHEAQSFEQAQELVQKLESAEVRFDVQAGDTGTLFGSVTATEIADKVWDTERVRIDRRKLELPESIKRIGRYQVPVELFTDVTATLRIVVVPEGGELPPEEELEALDAAAAEAEAAAAAEAEEARAAAAAATETAVAEAEAAAAAEAEAAAAEEAETGVEPVEGSDAEAPAETAPAADTQRPAS